MKIFRFVRIQFVFRNAKIMKNRTVRGWVSVSPIFVFLLVYLVTSVVAGDFYKVPVASAFLLASMYALIISGGKSVEEKIGIFSKGAGDRNVLLMLWIFILAGAFAGTAKSIGAIDATVNFTLSLLPGNLIFAGLFLAACFISMSIGTSVGTIVALVPIATGIAVRSGAGVGFVTAIIVGGAFFGDNLSFISDTTIAATRTQGCSMADKFKANIWLAAPAAAVVTAIYLAIGFNMEFAAPAEAYSLVKIFPYLAVIVLALTGLNVLVVLSIGLGLNAVIGMVTGSCGWTDFLVEAGSGIAGMGDLIIVTLLAGGMLEVIRSNGGIDFIIKGLTRSIHGRKGAEFCIAALVGLANLCTANNTIAIITTGDMARDISRRFGVDPRKSASIMDTFSCITQCIIPYGAQMLMASGLAGVSAFSIITHLYYPLALFAVAVLSILLGFPRRFTHTQASIDKEVADEK